MSTIRISGTPSVADYYLEVAEQQQQERERGWPDDQKIIEDFKRTAHFKLATKETSPEVIQELIELFKDIELVAPKGGNTSVDSEYKQKVAIIKSRVIEVYSKGYKIKDIAIVTGRSLVNIYLMTKDANTEYNRPRRLQAIRKRHSL